MESAEDGGDSGGGEGGLTLANHDPQAEALHILKAYLSDRASIIPRDLVDSGKIDLFIIFNCKHFLGFRIKHSREI